MEVNEKKQIMWWQTRLTWVQNKRKSPVGAYNLGTQSNRLGSTLFKTVNGSRVEDNSWEQRSSVPLFAPFEQRQLRWPITTAVSARSFPIGLVEIDELLQKVHIYMLPPYYTFLSSRAHTGGKNLFKEKYVGRPWKPSVYGVSRWKRASKSIPWSRLCTTSN